MAFKCEDCKEENGFKDIVDGIFKIIVVLGLIYLIYWAANNMDQIKELASKVSRRG